MPGTHGNLICNYLTPAPAVVTSLSRCIRAASDVTHQNAGYYHVAALADRRVIGEDQKVKRTRPARKRRLGPNQTRPNGGVKHGYFKV
jgi:hypothetical protein